MDESHHDALRRELREAVAQQIREGEPPETAATFARLRAHDIPDAEVWRLLSAALLMELNAIARDWRAFDRAGYVEALRALPTLLER